MLSPEEDVKSDRARAERMASALLEAESEVAAVASLLYPASVLWAAGGPDSARDPELTAAVHHFARLGTVPSTPHQTAVWVVIARAIAWRLASDSPSAVRVLAEVSRLESGPWWVRDVCRDELVTRIRALEHEQRRSWLDELGREPQRDEGSGISQAPISTRPTRADWRVQDVLQLWTDEVVAMDEPAVHVCADVLYRLDEVQWFRAVDRWSDPRLVQSVLFRLSQCGSCETLLSLLETARPCFFADGSFTSAAGAVVLCDALRSRTERMIAQTGDSEQRDSAQLLVQRFASIVLRRPDGAPLGLALAAHCGVLKTARRPQAPELAAALIFDALIGELTVRRIEVKDQREFLKLRRNSTRQRAEPVRRELPALMVALKTVAPEVADAQESLIAWLRDALIMADGWASTPDDLVREIASTLTKLDDPVRQCRSLFESLESQRIIAEFRDPYRALDVCVPSMIVLSVLTTLVGNQVSAAPESELAYVLDRAMRIHLTVLPHRGSSSIRASEVAGAALAVGCLLFGLEDARALRLVLPASHERPILASLLNRLAGAGTAHDVLHAFVRRLGLAPHDLVAGAKIWSDATGDQFDDAVAKSLVAILAGALNGKTESDETQS